MHIRSIIRFSLRLRRVKIHLVRMAQMHHVITDLKDEFNTRPVAFNACSRGVCQGV